MLRDAHGALLYEEMHTRGGFGGPFTYFYHRYPTTANLEVAASDRGYRPPAPATGEARPLRRRLYLSDRIAAGGQLLDRRVPVFYNADVTVLFARPTVSDDAYFANGERRRGCGSCRTGEAKLESQCGWLDVVAGDYVWIPRSMMHRWHLESP